MATYHICDFCGENLEQNDTIYKIILRPESMTHIFSIEKDSYNLEICPECGSRLKKILKGLEDRRNGVDCELEVRSPKSKRRWWCIDDRW